METGTESRKQVRYGVDLDVFTNTDRGWAAIEAAGHAVAAIVQGHGVQQVSVVDIEGSWYADSERAGYVSEEACVIFRLAGPMAAYACGLAEYDSCSRTHVPPLHHWEAAEAIQQWFDCPLYEVPHDEDDDDELRDLEADCLFELYKVRTMRFLKKPNRIRAVLALAQELMTRDEMSAEEATALIEQQLAT